jgi:hypothetical protein
VGRADVSRVYEHPNGEDNKVNKNEGEVSGKARHSISNLVRA